MERTLRRVAGVEHRYVELPGLRMHVADAGGGEPVLLLHGFPQHWWEWREIIPELAEHYRVIAPDLRGAGWTDAPPTGYNRDQLVADVVALLDDLGLDRVRLMAHDWGALVGYELCLRHPERVQSFVSLGVPHPYVKIDSRIIRNGWRSWYQLVIATPITGPLSLRAADQRFARFLLTSNVPKSGPGWSAEELDTFAGQLSDPDRAHAASALYRGFIMPTAAKILAGGYRGSRLSTSTLVLNGSNDPVVRPELLEGHEAYADDISVQTVDGASHFVVDEQPETVLAHALAYFAAN